MVQVGKLHIKKNEKKMEEKTKEGTKCARNSNEQEQ